MLSRSFVTSRLRSGRLLGALVAAFAVTVLAAVPAGADVSFINARRAAAGLPPVSDSGGLAGVAARHSAEMAAAGRLYHSTNLGATVSSVVAWQGVGENVGVGASLSDVNAMFMQSSVHRANILGNYNLAGVGTATGSDGRVWVTQVFARVASIPRTTTAAPTGSTGSVRSTTPSTSTATRSTTTRVSRRAPRTTLAATATPPRPAGAVAGLSSIDGGYRVVAEDGGVFTFGDAVFAGSAADLDLDEEIVGGSSTPSGNGYLLYGERGGVFAFGDAEFHGSAAGIELHAPVVGGASSPTGEGYRLFMADGGVLTFGDATFEGSLVGEPSNGAIVGGARTATGRGYWLAGADGGVYAFGDAAFHGSAAEVGALTAPIRSITATPSGRGYWLVGADGGVFAFGDAGYFGSLVGDPGAPVRALIAAPGAKGYWLIRSDRRIVPFGTVDGPVRHYFGIAGLRLV
ncbi:MAG TPA: CAP domain-containing protein [Acidimicrobiales bacterium]|nr:CAP domain-containing protein [Acidimicrobiales bacterium]